MRLKFRGIQVALLGMFLVLSQVGLAADKPWNKIRYEGGTVQAKVNPFDWNTTLKVAADTIQLDFAARKTLTIEARDVLALTYGEKACRRVADSLAPGPTSRPLSLFGLLHNGNDHLLGIVFRNQDGSQGAVFLTLHQDIYRDILQKLSTVTGKQVEDAP
jgi:hypothetical protein